MPLGKCFCLSLSGWTTLTLRQRGTFARLSGSRDYRHTWRANKNASVVSLAWLAPIEMGFV